MKTPRRTRLFTPAFALFLLAAGAATAQADPIVITSGTYVAERPSRNPIYSGSLNGENFSLAFSGRDFSAPHVIFCDPCRPGSARGISFQPVTITSIGVNVNGTHYFRGFDIHGPLPGSSPMLLTAMYMGQDLIIPAAIDPVVSVPFNFTGHLTIFDNTTLAPLHELDFVGQGILTVRFRTLFIEGLGQFQQFESLTYQFHDPVPEPATLVLLGTGLAGVAFKARRRRRNG